MKVVMELGPSLKALGVDDCSAATTPAAWHLSDLHAAARGLGGGRRRSVAWTLKTVVEQAWMQGVAALSIRAAMKTLKTLSCTQPLPDPGGGRRRNVA